MKAMLGLVGLNSWCRLCIYAASNELHQITTGLARTSRPGQWWKGSCISHFMSENARRSPVMFGMAPTRFLLGIIIYKRDSVVQLHRDDVCGSSPFSFNLISRRSKSYHSFHKILISLVFKCKDGKLPVEY
jgi:hypothetical protein